MLVTTVSRKDQPAVEGYGKHCIAELTAKKLVEFQYNCSKCLRTGFYGKLLLTYWNPTPHACACVAGVGMPA